MRKALTVIFAVASGMALTLVGFEVVLRMVPVQNGLFAGDPTDDWQVRHLVANGHYTFSEAWDLRNVHHGVTNNMCYVAPFDYMRGDAGIAVVGDSFIEGVMNRYEDTLQGQLAELLPDPGKALNFGASGASLADYIGIGPMVSKRFRIRWVVISVVTGDFAEAFAPPAGFFRWHSGETPPVQFIPQRVAGRLARALRTLAIVRYVRGNLKFEWRHFLHSSVKGSPEACIPETLSRSDSDLVDEYADSLPTAYGVSASHVVLVFDGDRKELYQSYGEREWSACPSRDSLGRQALAAAARIRGERVIEMAPIFAAYFRATGQRVDYSPIDWHWNAAGHRLAAREVARVMSDGSRVGPGDEDTRE
jgi:hypothetical protein